MIAFHYNCAGFINAGRVLLAAGLVTAAGALAAVYLASGLAIQHPEYQTGSDEATILPPTIGRQWVAALNGRPEGDGSKQSPWNLATALGGGPRGTDVKPGDMICLRGGVYKGVFTSRLQGTADAPIQIRSCANEWAILDKAAASRSSLARKSNWDVRLRYFERRFLESCASARRSNERHASMN